MYDAFYIQVILSDFETVSGNSSELFVYGYFNKEWSLKPQYIIFFILIQIIIQYFKFISV